MLQVLDEGHVTDTQGRTVSFRNCLIIMTSNLGCDEIAFGDKGRRGRKGLDIKEKVMSHVRAHFRPEFINRLDEFIVFEPLTHSQIMEIVQLQCAKLAERVAGQRMELDLEPSAIDYLARKGFDPTYGASPVKRAIQSELIQVMANQLLRGIFEEDDTIVVSADKDGLALTSGPKIVRDASGRGRAKATTTSPPAKPSVHEHDGRHGPVRAKRRRRRRVHLSGRGRTEKSDLEREGLLSRRGRRARASSNDLSTLKAQVGRTLEQRG